MNGQWLQLQDLVHPAIHLPMKIRMTNIQKVLFLLFHIHVGGGMLFNDLNEVVWMGTHVSIFVMAVLHALLGTKKLLIVLAISSQISKRQKHYYFRPLMENNNIICLQEVHGKD